MRSGNERKLPSSALDCDVGLGLKMNPSNIITTESSYSKRAAIGGLSWPFYNSSSSESNANVNVTCYGGDGSGGGGGPFLSHQVSCGGDLYQAADTTPVLPRTFHYNSSAFRSCSGQGGIFTVSQLEELERQKAIHKHMMGSSASVPPDFLFPISGTSSLPHPSSSLSQSNPSSILDLRFPSSGSDPEPWRCKRTDGKKWRCSRDVAPDQKYCERHAHKSRPRSRKPVEVPSHNSSSSATNSFILPAAAPPPRRPTYDQTRCIEWLVRGGNGNNNNNNDDNSAKACNQQSSRFEFGDQKNAFSSSVYRPQMQFQDNKQGFMASTFTNHPYNLLQNNESSVILDSLHGGGVLSLTADSDRTQQTTRHFIDAWEKDRIITTKDSTFSTKNFSRPSASLTLSMSGTGINGNNDDSGQYLGIGSMNQTNRETNNSVLNPNPNQTSGCWMTNSFPIPPGGPLGEALCLGNSNSGRGNIGHSNASPNRNGYSYSYSHSNTNSSKSSCEDGNHALNFIG